MTKMLKEFLADTSGAVSVDWVVLTASVVLLAAVTITAIQSGADDLAENAGTYMSDRPIN